MFFGGINFNVGGTKNLFNPLIYVVTTNASLKSEW